MAGVRDRTFVVVALELEELFKVRLAIDLAIKGGKGSNAKRFLALHTLEARLPNHKFLTRSKTSAHLVVNLVVCNEFFNKVNRLATNFALVSAGRAPCSFLCACIKSAIATSWHYMPGEVGAGVSPAGVASFFGLRRDWRRFISLGLRNSGSSAGISSVVDEVPRSSSRGGIETRLATLLAVLVSPNLPRISLTLIPRE